MEAISATPKEESTIQWKQLWSLAALYGSVVIGWIAYQNYQPKLLVQFEFTGFTFLLTLAQAVILIVTPPLAGRLGDKYRLKSGHRLPIITAGMSFAAMVFMAVAFTLLTNPGEIFKWILPVLIVFWLISMSIFTSPALSTMELFTPADKLPRAMAIITIVANLIYAVEPVIVDIIDYIGAPLTFISGGVVVFISGLALKRNSMNLFKDKDNKEDIASTSNSVVDTKESQYGFIFFLGAALGLATSVMFNLFPNLYRESLSVLIGASSPKVVLVAILLLSAVLSLPASSLVNRYGMLRSFWVSFTIVVLSMIGLFLFNGLTMTLILTVIFSASFTALSVSTLPLAISRANYYAKVFCVGIFFSGVALPEGIINAIQAF
jgi:MFS family permease